MTIGFFEALLLAGLIILLFGLGKLPTVLGDLGRGIRSFREEMAAKDGIQREPARETAETGSSDRRLPPPS